jgi:hypothetical protein
MRKSSPVWHQKVQSSLASESPVQSGIFGIALHRVATIAAISIEVSDPNPGSIIVIASDITVKCPPSTQHLGAPRAPYNRGPSHRTWKRWSRISLNNRNNYIGYFCKANAK